MLLDQPKDDQHGKDGSGHLALRRWLAWALNPDAFGLAAVHPFRPAADFPFTVSVGEAVAGDAAS